MTWARRLKRVFRIDVEVCEHGSGAVKIIACIERPDVIDRILRHLWCKHNPAAASRHQSPRAPPFTLWPKPGTDARPSATAQPFRRVPINVLP